MTQDAIDEMVEQAFAQADTNNDGKISAAEFASWVCMDAALICGCVYCIEQTRRCPTAITVSFNNVLYVCASTLIIP